MRKLIFICICLGTIVLVGCAGAALKSEYKQKRGYSDVDIKAIETLSSEYAEVLAKGRVNSNAFSTTEKVNAEGRIKTIYCACIKKMGEKCRQKSDGLKTDERKLWIKGNAAELALTGMQANDNPLAQKKFFIDDEECIN